MQSQLTQEQLKILGIDTLLPAEQDRTLVRMGEMIFMRALLRLTKTLDQDALRALDYTIDALDNIDAIVAHIENTFPEFKTYIAQEQKSHMQNLTRVEI